MPSMLNSFWMYAAIQFLLLLFIWAAIIFVYRKLCELNYWMAVSYRLNLKLMKEREHAS